MNFRRVLTALALIAAFTAIASAQLPTSQNLTCSVSAATSPSIRAEGQAELVGDVLITCTGGPAQVNSAADLGYVKIVVDFGVPVTSKPLGTAFTTGAIAGDQPVEALIAVDEPGTTSPVGAISVCTATAQAASPSTCSTAFVASTPGVAETISGDNTFQGVIPKDKPNQVAFYRVPVLTLGGTSFQHIFRITNVRVTPGASAVVATVTPTPLATSNIGMGTLNPATATVATPTAGMTATVAAGGLSLCNTTDLTGTKGNPNMALLTFKENFNGAFKSQLVIIGGTPVTQNKIGGVYGTAPNTVAASMSESGLVTAVSTLGNAGLADSPTRLKAVFTGLDKNVKYYVSVNNVGDYTTALAAANQRAALLPQAPPTGVAMETQVAGTYETPDATAWGAIAVKQLAVSGKGVAEAVWEITNPDYKNAEQLAFAVYAEYSTLSSPPAVSSGQSIQLGFAPSITSTTTDAANTWIPRFAAPPAAVPGAPVLLCQTSLLFPYVTNVAGWETGIALSNTGKDPLNTTGSSGTCALSFYGTNAPTAAVSVAAIDPGATYANTLSGMGLANFTGYMVGVCNFKYAHGFAFINDGKQDMAMGYLALVMTGTGRGTTLLGEALNQ